MFIATGVAEGGKGDILSLGVRCEASGGAGALLMSATA
jgi:hypothetical protein